MCVAAINRKHELQEASESHGQPRVSLHPRWNNFLGKQMTFLDSWPRLGQNSKESLISRWINLTFGSLLVMNVEDAWMNRKGN